MTEPKFPKIIVHLVGSDGNAFVVLGKVRKALQGTATAEEIQEFLTDAMSSDYNHLLQVTMKWVCVD